MHDVAILVQKYGRMVWQHHWMAFVVCAILCSAGWVVLLYIPNQYMVSATVFVDTRSLLKPLMHGLTVDSASQEDVARMVHRMLLVRENLATVARQTGMDETAHSPKEFERLLGRLREEVQITPGQEENTFELSYASTDPKLAFDVVESLLRMFVERSRGEKQADAVTSRRFLDRQIKEYETRLRNAEQRLEAFKREHAGLMQDTGYFERLEALEQESSQVALKLKEAKSRRDQLKRDVQEMADLLNVPFFAETADNAGLSHPLDGRIVALQEQLDELLMTYTERHPTIIATQRLLDQLVKEKQEALIKAALEQTESGVSQRATQNPLYGGLRVALANAESEVAALSARQRELAHRKEKLNQQRDAAFDAETRLKDLNRDYEIQKGNYEEFVRRSEALAITDKVRQTADEFKFRLVEPPREPLLPSGPERLKLNAFVLVFGIGAGAAMAWLLAQLKPKVYTKEELTEVTPLPVLGSVSLLRDRKMLLSQWASNAGFGFALVFLAMLYITFTVQDPDVLQAFLSNLVSRIPAA
jgi:polysaccharide chain length determinant protein (PEP-CTERM system associated)